MNNVVETIKNHRSIRQYLDKDIPTEIVDEIVKAAQAMPNSINGQQTSVIVIRDKEKKAKLAELVGNQEYVAKAPVFLVFVMDFYRTYLAGEKTSFKQVIHEDIEGVEAGSVDVGIALGASIIAAESFGLGIVPIGGIRKNPDEVIELLGLPKYTFPMVGLVLGYPVDESHQKPRVPFNSFRHEEIYATKVVEESIDAYDKQMSEYLKDIGRSEQETNWSTFTSKIYQSVYYPKVKPAMDKQGFKTK
ncbi:FMN reductase [Clostridium puniceum]|uniref:FMN reductase n=1 Tax=Clostridium puniceum TaxID=29367 RepID=A0A1S8TKH0_9CLOT|nr:NADPH-dependent oxidoreductase [Clostridium puniceum]OOM78166.1 FMN reductase [Clostridium puniceum]